MNGIVERLIGVFIDKKRVIGWISAVVIAVSAVAAGLSSQEFKDAVCAGPVIEAPGATK